MGIVAPKSSKLRFILLFVVCFNTLVIYMHNATIAIALVSMCDHTCELILTEQVDSKTVEELKKANVTTIVHEMTPDELEYLEFSGDVSAVAINWLHMSEEGMSNISDHGTITTQCYLKQIEKCKKFNWTHTMKALVLSASYWSSLLFQIPCSIVVREFGGFWVLVVSSISIGIIDVILPTAAYFNFTLVIVLRFIFGLLLTASSPAAYKLIDEWMMNCDKSISMAMLTASQTLGNVIILTTSGYLVHCGYDWSNIFYLSSMFSIFSVTILIVIAKETPDQAAWMPRMEVDMIKEDKFKRISTECPSSESIKNVKTPWFDILTNPSYNSLLFFIFSTACNTTIYATELPVFLDQVSGINVASNGILNGATNLTRIFAILLSGFLSERLIDSQRFTRTQVRKFFSIILGFGQGMCLIMLPFATRNIYYLTIILLLATFSSGASSGSVLPIHYEFSVKYPVLLLTISNTAANATGILVPIGVSLTQMIFSKNLIFGWIVVFVTIGIMSILSNIIFLLRAKAERQPFDNL